MNPKSSIKQVYSGGCDTLYQTENKRKFESSNSDQSNIKKVKTESTFIAHLKETKEFQKLSKEQIYSLLHTELSLRESNSDKIKHLFNEPPFNGVSLANIAGFIQQLGIGEALKLSFDIYPTVSRKIISGVVLWVGKIVSPRIMSSSVLDSDEWIESQIKKNPEIVYDESFKQYLERNGLSFECVINDDHQLEQIIHEIITNHEFTFKSIQLKSHEKFIHALPVMEGERKGELVIAKHHLPYIPSLHVQSTIDTELTNTNSNNFTLIAPSGMGKTGLIIRQLCKYPGILITGGSSSEIESRQTSDYGVKLLMGLFLFRIEAFAFIRQAVLLLIITKLVHVLDVIEKYYIDPTIAANFENNLFALIAFSQSNGNSKTEEDLFYSLFCKLKYSHVITLRKYATKLIDEIKRKTNSSTFVIGVDEANVLEEHSKFKYHSCDGNLSGVLTIFVSEITRLNESGLNIYAGTSFSIDISNNGKSIGKTESKRMCVNLVQFEYLNEIEFTNYLSEHVKFESFTMQPKAMRIRQAALCLELYVNDILLQKDNYLSIPLYLLKSFNMMTEDLIKAAQLFVQRTPELRSEFIEALNNYIIHYEYREMLGSSFEVSNQLASHLVKCGLTCPVKFTSSSANQKTIEFRAVDHLGYELAQLLLEDTTFKKVQQTIDLAMHVINNTDSRKQVKKGICIGFCSLNGKKLSSLFNFTSCINSTLMSRLQNIECVCEKVLTPTTYIEYCKQNDWIDSNSSIIDGEELYFDNMLNHPERVLKILFRPIDYAHDDAILVLKTETSDEYISLRFSFKFLTGKYIDDGYKSTRPELMCVDDYKKVDLDTLDSFYKSALVEKNGNITCDAAQQLGIACRSAWFVFIENQEEIAQLFGDEFACTISGFLSKIYNEE